MSTWNEIELGNVASYGREKIDATSLNSNNYVSTDNMIPGRQGIVGSEYVPSKGRVSKFIYADILVSNIRPYFKKIWFADKVGGCSNDVIVFKTDKSIADPKFLYYQLSRDEFFDFMMAGANGTKMPRGNKNSIPTFKFLLPPLLVQRKIALFLSAYDALIENNLKRTKLLEELAQRTYQEWFAKLRKQGRQLKINNETGLPEGWQKIKLGELADFKYGTMADSNMVVKEGYPIYSGYRITGYYPKYNIDEPAIIIVARGVGGTGDVKLSPRKCWLTNLAIQIVPRELTPKYFLFYKLKNENMRALDSGAAQSQITIISLTNYEITLPDTQTQHTFDEFYSSIAKQLEILRNQIALLKEARDILLKRLMSGEVEV